MELLQLKYFCDAAETENFSRTAKKFLVPTSDISQSVKRLERELGCELFEHQANRIRLNDNGKIFYENASQALSLLKKAETRLAEQKEHLSGDIRVVCLNNRRIVTAAVEAFVRQYLDVHFIVHHNPDDGELFDLFISDTCPYEYGKRMLIVDEEICVALDRNHPLSGKSDFSLSDLRNEKFITMTANNSLRKITENACANAGFPPDFAIQTDDPALLRKYVEMGLGVALIPANSWKGLFSDRVVLKKLDNIRRKTYAFLPKGREENATLELFLQILLQEAIEQEK